MEPRLVGTRRLMMLIPGYLTTNQLGECLELITQSTTPFLTLSLKPIPWEFPSGPAVRT